MEEASTMSLWRQILLLQEITADGLNPTCLSATNFADITCRAAWSLDAMLLGLQSGYTIIPRHQTPFYQLSGAGCTKQLVLTWIRNVASRLKAGDGIILVFVAHGERGSTHLILNHRSYGQGLPTKTGIIAALSSLPAGVKSLANQGDVFLWQVGLQQRKIWALLAMWWWRQLPP